MSFDRERLYEEVWAEPMTAIAARYEVSSSFLARVCKRMNVPRPPRGYWAKLKIGKATSRPPLLEASPGDELEWVRNGEPRRVRPALLKPLTDLPSRRRRPKRNRPSHHPLLIGIQEHYDEAKVSDSGYLRPKKKKLVDVFVTKDTLDRTLDTANELFLALEDRGYQVTIAPHGQHHSRPDVDERIKGGRDRYYRESWSPIRPTIVSLGTLPIGLTFFELSAEVEVIHWRDTYIPISQVTEKIRKQMEREHTWKTTRDVPTGRLCLRATSPYYSASWEKQWRESKPGSLRKQIPKIIRCLENEAPKIAQLIEESERQAEIERQRWEEERLQWQREEEELRRIQAHKESREQLLKLIEEWALACRIESFFESLLKAKTGMEEQERETFKSRLDRARKMFGGVDALKFFRAWKTPEEISNN